MKDGTWDKQWLLVTELQRVDRLNIAVAQSKATKGELRGNGTIADPLDVLLTAEASFSLDATDVFQLPNARDTTALRTSEIQGAVWSWLETYRFRRYA